MSGLRGSHKRKHDDDGSRPPSSRSPSTSTPHPHVPTRRELEQNEEIERLRNQLSTFQLTTSSLEKSLSSVQRQLEELKSQNQKEIVVTSDKKHGLTIKETEAIRNRVPTFKNQWKQDSNAFEILQAIEEAARSLDRISEDERHEAFLEMLSVMMPDYNQWAKENDTNVSYTDLQTMIREKFCSDEELASLVQTEGLPYFNMRKDETIIAYLTRLRDSFMYAPFKAHELATKFVKGIEAAVNTRTQDEVVRIISELTRSKKIHDVSSVATETTLQEDFANIIEALKQLTSKARLEKSSSERPPEEKLLEANARPDKIKKKGNSKPQTDLKNIGGVVPKSSTGNKNDPPKSKPPCTHCQKNNPTKAHTHCTEDCYFLKQNKKDNDTELICDKCLGNHKTELCRASAFRLKHAAKLKQSLRGGDTKQNTPSQSQQTLPAPSSLATHSYWPPPWDAYPGYAPPYPMPYMYPPSQMSVQQPTTSQGFQPLNPSTSQPKVIAAAAPPIDNNSQPPIATQQPPITTTLQPSASGSNPSQHE